MYVYRMATNDEIRLKLTVSKMNIHRSAKLETIAAKCIARDLHLFLNPKYSDRWNVMHLPISLRNIVLQHWLMRQFAELKKPQVWFFSNDDSVKILDERMKVFQSLISCHTLEVDLTPFIKDCYNVLAREPLLEFLNLICAKATNLKFLEILGFDDLSVPNETFCDAICKLRNLISLNIWNIHITYTNLKAMCKNLKSLTHLYTRLHFDPSFDESNEREIEELQIFSNLIYFQNGVNDEKFTLNCIQHLPKLQSIDNCTTSIAEQLLDRCPDQKFALTHMELTELTANKEVHMNFPDVTDLEVRYRNSDISVIPDSLPKFSKIEILSSSCFPSVDTMIRFLDAYGHGLHSLRLSFCRGQFKLSSILDRCPKLQSLFLSVVSILPECSRPDIYSFPTGLKELFWHPRFSSDDHAPFLLEILSVPTLESVTLYMKCENFHLEDIEKLTAMIASRQILGNLRRFKLLVYDMEMDINHRYIRQCERSAYFYYPQGLEIVAKRSGFYVLQDEEQYLEWKCGRNGIPANALPANQHLESNRLYFGKWSLPSGEIIYGPVVDSEKAVVKLKQHNRPLR
ncbi:Hypothetical predicted protein [Cloeon dipterum]|uniref:Uncharacterized protein n=1 Tax=Cloeon dipterum TaxID=197152 RepID=A0A8S1E0D1_9INSE|nr:Hypothetical predicted protein [Cloeon dipterum]